MSSAVVVLPLVPVTPTSGLGSRRAASSTSLHTGTPAARAAATGAASPGTPGLLTTRSTAGDRAVVGRADLDAGRGELGGVHGGAVDGRDRPPLPGQQQGGGPPRAGQPHHQGAAHPWSARK